MPGHSAAPAPIRLLHGRSPGRDSGGRKVEPAPGFRRLPPNPPSHLSREAKAEWKRIVPELARLELLKPMDRAALTLYCETWATWVAAKRDVRIVGLTVENRSTRKDGTESVWLTRNPAVAVMETAGGQLMKFAREFGLTPSAEGQLKPKDADGPDPDANPFA